jgi:hypothetical protein
LQDLIKETILGKAIGFNFSLDRVLKTRYGRTIVPNDAELRREVLHKLIKYSTLFISAITKCARI